MKWLSHVSVYSSLKSYLSFKSHTNDLHISLFFPFFPSITLILIRKVTVMIHFYIIKDLQGILVLNASDNIVCVVQVSSRVQVLAAGTSTSSSFSLMPTLSWSPEACVTVYSILPSGEVVCDTAHVTIDRHGNVLLRCYLSSFSLPPMRSSRKTQLCVFCWTPSGVSGLEHLQSPARPGGVAHCERPGTSLPVRHHRGGDGSWAFKRGAGRVGAAGAIQHTVVVLLPELD